jgi:hypothetical protein
MFELSFLPYFIYIWPIKSPTSNEINGLAIVARGGGQAPWGVRRVYVYVQLHRSGFLVCI